MERPGRAASPPSLDELCSEWVRRRSPDQLGLQRDLPSTRHTVQFDVPLEIKELGYLFVYLSYDNNQGSLYLYFDDLKVVVDESPLIQVNNYYPFGMVSNTWLREGEQQNANLFQGKELIAQTGWHDFGSRMYWADLGRWFSTDPQKQFSSPYVGMGNMPGMGRDPDGEFFWLAPIIGALIGGTAQGINEANNGGSFLEGFGKGALIGGLAGAGAAGVSVLGGGAMLAGATGGALGGAGFAGLNSKWDPGAMWKGFWIGGLSGAIGGGFAAAVGGSEGAFVGGVAADITGQYLSTGEVNLAAAGLSGLLSWGLYHGTSKIAYEMGGKKFGEIDLTYKEFKTIQADYQRSRFWRKEYGGTLLKNGNPIRLQKSSRHKGHVVFDSPKKMGVDPTNIKAKYHIHWAYNKGANRLNFARYHSDPADYSEPYNSIVLNRYDGGANYNVFDYANNQIIMTKNVDIVKSDLFARFFLFSTFFK